MKRVLLISYAFPPVGGAGVQRVTKFVKYLPAHGWLPSVLTVANPSVPTLDQSLLKDIPADVPVHRARTWEPGYSTKATVTAMQSPEEMPRRWSIKSRLKSAGFSAAKLLFQPDPQVLWMFNAIRAGRRILDQAPHSSILVSGPPFSTFLIGASLSRTSGLPLVLDYRDEWDISNKYWENKRSDGLSGWLQSRMQRRVVRSARALIATTSHSASALEEVCARSGSGERTIVRYIYNGFDPDDLLGGLPPQERPRDIYRLSYVGTLWNLTDASPLVAGIEVLAKRSPELSAKLEIIFAGRRTEPQSRVVARLGALNCKLREMPYVDHNQAVGLLKDSDGLCALLSDLPAAQRVVPAKIFEYMACRKPIVAIGPFGEMWDILKSYPAAILKKPTDVAGIADALADEIRRKIQGRQIDLQGWDSSPYDRRAGTGELAKLLDQITPGGETTEKEPSPQIKIDGRR